MSTRSASKRANGHDSSGVDQGHAFMRLTTGSPVDGIPRPHRSASGTMVAGVRPAGGVDYTSPLTQSSWCSGCLNEPDDVAVGVGHRCDQPAAPDILDRLMLDGTDCQEPL